MLEEMFGKWKMASGRLKATWEGVTWSSTQVTALASNLHLEEAHVMMLAVCKFCPKIRIFPMAIKTPLRPKEGMDGLT